MTFSLNFDEQNNKNYSKSVDLIITSHLLDDLTFNESFQFNQSQVSVWIVGLNL